MRISLTLLLGIPVLAVLLATSSLRAEEDDEGGPLVTLQTTYLTEKAAGARRIKIMGRLGGLGEVQLDPNTCALNAFGDATICTEIAALPIRVAFKQLKLADPSGQGRRLYLLDGQLAKGHKLFLVVPRRRSEPHRLVVESGEDRRRVLTLEAIPARKKPSDKAKLCQTAKYAASQSGSTVTVEAGGMVGTPGWKVEFVRLPIRIFPPQYKLACTPPEGLVPQVMTPFSASTSFESEQAIKEVVVHDAKGRHRVPVRQAGGR